MKNMANFKKKTRNKRNKKNNTKKNIEEKPTKPV